MIAIALFLALASSSPVAAFGSGARDCKTALSESNYASSYAWVMGYFSGANAAARANVGQTTDGDGIMAEVALQCRREPSLQLIDAAERVYESMRDVQR